MADAGQLPGLHVERRRLDHLKLTGAQPRPPQCPDGSLVAVGHLPEAHRPTDEGDPLVPLLQQMRHGEVAAEHVVDRHRALAVGRRSAVHEHHRSAPALQPREPVMGAGHRRDQDPLHPVLLQQFQVVRFLDLLIVAVAQDDGQARLAGLVLDPACHVGEERVRHVEHDQPYGPAPPGPELARRLVPDETQMLDGRLHPAAGGLGHHVRPVEHVRDSAHRNARVRGNVPDADRRVGHDVPAPPVPQVCGDPLERVKQVSPGGGRAAARVGDASRAGRACGPAWCVCSTVRRRQGRYREVM